MFQHLPFVEELVSAFRNVAVVGQVWASLELGWGQRMWPPQERRTALWSPHAPPSVRLRGTLSAPRHPVLFRLALPIPPTPLSSDHADSQDSLFLETTESGIGGWGSAGPYMVSRGAHPRVRFRVAICPETAECRRLAGPCLPGLAPAAPGP